MMTVNEDLIEWNTHWRVSAGVVTCRTCHAHQSESDSRSQFEHSAGCGHSGQKRAPWDDLDMICRRFERKV